MGLNNTLRRLQPPFCIILLRDHHTFTDCLWTFVLALKYSTAPAHDFA